MSPEVGSVVGGKYRLFKPLARGGMGSIWVARHTELDVSVAVKLIAPELVASDTAVNRFRHEARAAAQLRSPHVVQILDYGVDGGLPYMAMELLAGEDLGALIEREGRLHVERVLALLRPVCKALKLAHEARIVHRDLKPANIYVARVGDDEVVKVLDFGIAKALGGDGSTKHTASATLVGSPLYMSPEQSRGDPVDARTDIWSLGVVAFEVLVGRPPFEGRGLGDVFAQICHAPTPKPSDFGVHVPGLDAFFARALAKSPADRHASVSDWLAELEACARAARRPLATAGSMPPGSAFGDSLSVPADARTGVVSDSLAPPDEPRRASDAVAGAEVRRGPVPWLVGLSIVALAAVGVFAWSRDGGAGGAASRTDAPSASPVAPDSRGAAPAVDGGGSPGRPDVSLGAPASSASASSEPAPSVEAVPSAVDSTAPAVSPMPSPRPSTSAPPAAAGPIRVRPGPTNPAPASCSTPSAPTSSRPASTTDPVFGIPGGR